MLFLNVIAFIERYDTSKNHEFISDKTFVNVDIYIHVHVYKTLNVTDDTSSL